MKKMKTQDRLDVFEKHINTILGDIQSKLNYLQEYIENVDNTKVIEINLNSIDDLVKLTREYDSITVKKDDYGKYTIKMGE